MSGSKTKPNEIHRWVVIKRLDGIYEPLRIPYRPGPVPEKIKYVTCDKLQVTKAKFSHYGKRDLPHYSEYKVYPVKITK